MTTISSVPKEIINQDNLTQDISPSYYLKQIREVEGKNFNQKRELNKYQVNQSLTFPSRGDLHSKDSEENPYLVGQQRRNQVRQFTLGNETSEIGSSSQLTNSAVRQLTASASHQHLLRSIPPVSQSNETEQLKKMYIELQARISRLEERATANEEKLEISERLSNLKGIKNNDQPYTSHQIKQEIETSVRNILATQSVSEGDRIIDCLRSIDSFQSRLLHSESVFIRVSKDIEQRFQEEIALQQAHIERVILEVRQKTTNVDKTNEKFVLYSKQNSDILEKIMSISKDIEDLREDKNQYNSKTKKSIDTLFEEQKKLQESLQDQLIPTIKSLEDDMLRILKGQKEITDITHITQYLEDEVLQLKHKIKMILQAVSIKQTRYSNSESVAQFRLINK